MASGELGPRRAAAGAFSHLALPVAAAACAVVPGVLAEVHGGLVAMVAALAGGAGACALTLRAGHRPGPVVGETNADDLPHPLLGHPGEAGDDPTDGAGDSSAARPPSDWEARQAAEAAVRERAQTIIDETAGIVIQELCELIDHVDHVRRSALEIDEQVARTENVTRLTVAQATTADGRVHALGESLREVSGMTALIGTIAAQTKLLALNATIEAARAGDAGRGFSVVANEVKTLAASTAHSTERITQTLERLDEDAEKVAQAITTVGRDIAGLDEASAALSDVAARQQDLVARLDDALAATVQRVSELSTLATRLERRGAERRPVQASITIRSAAAGGGTIFTGQVRDMSVTGLRCSVNGGSVPDKGLEVTIDVDTGRRAFSCAGVVAREIPADTGREIGLFFTRLSEQVTATVNEILESAAPAPAAPSPVPARAQLMPATSAATDDVVDTSDSGDDGGIQFF